MFLSKVMSKNITQVFTYNSEKNVFKDLFTFEISCSELNKT